MQPREIRELTQHDSAEWWRLRLEALEREPQAFSSAAEDHRQTTVEAAAARIAAAAPESIILGAFQIGTLAGVAGFHREQESKSRHKGRVWGVYVTEACRGSGVGRALMRSTEQVAARRLYESHGFVAFGRDPRALLAGGKYVDEDYYVLMLG